MLHHYEAEIKEVFNDNVLKPAYFTEERQSTQDLIKMWGLNEPDIEWFRLYEVVGENKFKLS